MTPIGVSEVTSNSISCPSPPRNLPAPPLPRTKLLPVHDERAVALDQLDGDVGDVAGPGVGALPVVTVSCAHAAVEEEDVGVGRPVRAHAGLDHAPERRAGGRHDALGDDGRERAEHGEGQVVAGRHATADGGGEARIDDGARGRRHVDAAEDALVVGEIGEQHAFERVGRHGEGVGHRAVDGAIDLGAGARIVDADPVAGDGERRSCR